MTVSNQYRSGYASFDYELCGYKQGDLTKLSILVNSEQVDALCDNT